MKTTDISYGFVVFLCINILFLFSETPMVRAQPTPSGGGSNNNNNYPYARFSPSMAIIIVVLIAALFFMGFFSIYIRHCSENSSGSVRRALSLRSRRTQAARGLEASVLETFPTFSYSEVKDHKIGKGTLECAVCLNEFQEDETIRLIPKCDHVFHPECIDAWLESHVTCPVCRANLAQPEPASANPVGENEANQMNETVERSSSTGTGGEVVIQVENEVAPPPPPPRSWSVARRPIMFKFRSHSTGHDSLVPPGENLDRFTLKLPEQVRKEVVDRAMLNRAKSYAAGGSWGRGARSYRRIERPELEVKSERWNFSFFSRALSMRSPRVGSENAQGSRSGPTPVKMPSFKCFEPKAVDEAHLVSARSPV